MNKSIVEPIKIKPNYPTMIVHGILKIDYDARIKRIQMWWKPPVVEPTWDSFRQE